MQIPASTQTVAVIGAGSWGTALAALIARHGARAVLWGRDPQAVEAIASRHENPRYLPGIPLPDALEATTDLAACVAQADLVLTSTGDLSRNRRLGLALGRGQSLKEAVREIGQVVESVQTADEVMRQADRHGVELPISSAVQQVLHGEITPAEGLKLLLSRERKPEYPQGLFGP